MKDYYCEFSLEFSAKDIDERDEILARFQKALESTEWKVEDVECIACEET